MTGVQTCALPISHADQKRLVDALRMLNAGERLPEYVDVDRLLRYFTVQVFVVNLDSYIGLSGHNYILYEEAGRLSMLPWDYNLAYATYALGMPNPVNDPTLFVNYPIDTPAPGRFMLNRPLYHQIMLQPEYYHEYHNLFDSFIRTYFESGYFTEKISRTRALIAPYVQQDHTRFVSYEDFLIGVDAFQQFCLLRAESVRGQLDGLIPTTIQGQKRDRRNFVDASELN